MDATIVYREILQAARFEYCQTNRQRRQSFFLINGIDIRSTALCQTSNMFLEPLPTLSFKREVLCEVVGGIIVGDVKVMIEETVRVLVSTPQTQQRAPGSMVESWCANILQARICDNASQRYKGCNTRYSGLRGPGHTLYSWKWPCNCYENHFISASYDDSTRWMKDRKNQPAFTVST